MRTTLFMLFACAVVSAHGEVPLIRGVQWGDLHTGLVSQHGQGSNHTHCVEWCITNDVSFFVWAGDCFEQNSNSWANVTEQAWSLADLTNAAWRLKTNGIAPVVTDGNHECDQISGNIETGIYGGGWTFNDEQYRWTNVFPLSFFEDCAGYITGYNNGNIQQYAITVTNEPLKLLFVIFDSSITGKVSLAHTANEVAPQITWATNIAAQFPDHQFWGVGHFVISMQEYWLRGMTLGGFGSVANRGVWPRLGEHDRSDNGDSQANRSYKNHGLGRSVINGGLTDTPNFMGFLSGHTRLAPKAHVSVRCADGHVADVSTWNLQSASDGSVQANGIFINVIDFFEDRRVARFSTVDLRTGDEVSQYSTNIYGSLFGGFAYTHTWEVPWAINPPKAGGYRLR